ncbi:hypothetical protein TNIN_121951 [Trichonephila inaurata madagascariensis]|uniref:Uncharacterized protein n=1 Tax=Trichonephila inaurata madagascariensis TaxID=2747483 RepID=A0A8X6WPG5_9ARAC|nr:hypothetical protein TNIN_121951 [Trichonephila inaurata madagascariensis]
MEKTVPLPVFSSLPILGITFSCQAPEQCCRVNGNSTCKHSPRSRIRISSSKIKGPPLAKITATYTPLHFPSSWSSSPIITFSRPQQAIFFVLFSKRNNVSLPSAQIPSGVLRRPLFGQQML